MGLTPGPNPRETSAWGHAVAGRVSQAIPSWAGCGVLCVQGPPGLLAAAAWVGLGCLGHTPLASPDFQHYLCLGESLPLSTWTFFNFPALQLLHPS